MYNNIYENFNYKIFFASIFAVLVLVILNASFFQHKAKADSSDYQYINITSSDISQAGYSGVSQQSPENNMYQSPNLYFWVNNSSESNPMSGKTFDLLMVSQYTNGLAYNNDLFSYGTSTHSVDISGAKAQEDQLDYGRVALNFSKGNYYFVIIGPNAQNVEALAKNIAGKIQ